MNNQGVSYAELNLHGNLKTQRRKSKDCKSSVTVTEQETTYTELHLQNFSQDTHGNDKHYYCKDLPSPLVEKLIAGILALLCLALVVPLITVISSSNRESNNSSASNWTQKAYSCKRCPEEWFKHSNSCYYISSEQKTWNESLEDCFSKNSKLLYIDNKEEMNTFKNLNILSWSGLFKRNNDSLLVWSDGSNFSSKAFSVKQEKQEKCFYVDFSKNQFISESCSDRRMYVCRHQLVSLI